MGLLKINIWAITDLQYLNLINRVVHCSAVQKLNHKLMRKNLISLH